MRKNNIAKLLCTWFGAGLSPLVPGTVGSLAALPFVYFMQVLMGPLGALLFALLVFQFGLWASRVYLAETGKSDPGEIVIDEVAGQSLLLAFFLPTWQSYLLGFVLFRLFDIVKPWPVSLADRKIKGAFGVMFDDILAALYPVLLFWLALNLMDRDSARHVLSLLGYPLEM